jgi:hypothetical protein
MRALAALRMVWASAVWMAVEMLATWCVRKLRGDARPSPYRVLSVAPGRRVWRARRRRMVGCERTCDLGDECEVKSGHLTRLGSVNWLFSSHLTYEESWPLGNYM